MTLEDLARKAGLTLGEWTQDAKNLQGYHAHPERTQLTRFAALVRNEALEDAALECDSLLQSAATTPVAALVAGLARNIRALKGEP